MASREELSERFASLQKKRKEYKIKLAARAKEETQIIEEPDSKNLLQTTEDKIPEQSEQNQKVKKPKQKTNIYEKELEDLTFSQLKTRLTGARKRVQELERLINAEANGKAREAWNRRGPPGGRDPRKEGGEPILSFHKKLVADLEKSDQRQSAYTEGPGSGTFDEGFEATTTANHVLFQRICEKLSWEYVLELLREHVPKGEIHDNSGGDDLGGDVYGGNESGD